MWLFGHRLCNHGPTFSWQACLILIWCASGQHLKENDPKHVNVAAPVKRFVSVELLGAHVIRGANDGIITPLGAACQFGNPEIRDVWVILLIEQNMAGLQVAMNDASGVCLVKSRCQMS